MALTDLPLTELRGYRAQLTEPDDFDAFWRTTLAEARAIGGTVSLAPAETPISELLVEDLSFPGFGGETGASRLPASARRHTLDRSRADVLA